MANSFNGGRIHIDTASEQVVATDRRVKIAYILFVPDANEDQIVLRESSTGDVVFKLSSANAKESKLMDFARDPIVMNGVYVDTVSTNAIAILYTTSRGGA